MNFDWDKVKNEDNVRKHGLDFADAWKVFSGPMFTTIDDRFNYGELRTVGTGLLHDLIVVLVFTETENGIIRIISMRKALKYERQRFYKFIKDQLGPLENDVG